SLTDAVARIHRGRAVDCLSAEIGTPGFGPGAGLGRQSLAMLVGALEAAKIRAGGTAGTGDEERHVGELRRRLLRLRSTNRRRHDYCGGKRRHCLRSHGLLPVAGRQAIVEGWVGTPQSQLREAESSLQPFTWRPTSFGTVISMVGG